MGTGARVVKVELGDGGGGGESVIMVLFCLVVGIRYQLGHCPVSCSSCNICFFIYLFYFTFFPI